MSQDVTYPPRTHQPAPPPSRRGPGRTVALLAAAVIAGGTAGLGGAAAWDAIDPSPAATTTAGDTGGAAANQPVAAPTPSHGDGSVESVASSVLPSVVQLQVSGPSGAGSGSGIVLSADGQILTNNHVVEAAGPGGDIRVDLPDGSHATGRVIGTDPLTDIAVVQAEGVSDLTPAMLGTSGGLAVGQQVVAVGSPYGLDSTVTTGIVSALNRPVDVGTDGQGNVTAYPAIQTDAAINPGNSGGPLVDMGGRVVGVNASIRGTMSANGQAGSIGLGFAIPIDQVKPIVDQIVAGETPTHARLGVSLEAPQGALDQASGDGARVAEVPGDGAAAQAGLQPGDVITRVDSHRIAGAEELITTIRSYRPGDKVDVTWVRGGHEQTTAITLGSDADSANG